MEAISRSYSVVTRNFFAVNFYEQLMVKIFQFLRLTTRLFLAVSRLRVNLWWWPTTVTAKEITSRHKKKTHGKKKNLTAKRKRLTAKRKRLTAKEKYFFCESFSFAVRLFLLLWVFCFSHKSLSFCRQVFSFVVSLFVFAVRFFLLPWGSFFWWWGSSFCRIVGHRINPLRVWELVESLWTTRRLVIYKLSYRSIAFIKYS